MSNCDISTPNKLFNRPQDQGYLEEWSKLLAEPKEILEEIKENPFVVFRICNEWFGLSALVFSEIISQRPINVMPYKTDPILLGVVNLRGRLCLCISLHRLLGMGVDFSYDEQLRNKIHYSRMITLSKDGELWTFPVDEVDSVYQFEPSKMTNVPINIVYSKENFLKGVVNLGDRKVNILDEEIIFATLLRRNL